MRLRRRECDVENTKQKLLPRKILIYLDKYLDSLIWLIMCIWKLSYIVISNTISEIEKTFLIAKVCSLY